MVLLYVCMRYRPRAFVIAGTGLRSFEVAGLVSHLLPAKLRSSCWADVTGRASETSKVCLCCQLLRRIRDTPSYEMPNFSAKKALLYVVGSDWCSAFKPAMAENVNFLVGCQRRFSDRQSSY